MKQNEYMLASILIDVSNRNQVEAIADRARLFQFLVKNVNEGMSTNIEDFFNYTINVSKMVFFFLSETGQILFLSS